MKIILVKNKNKFRNRVDDVIVVLAIVLGIVLFLSFSYKKFDIGGPSLIVFIGLLLFAKIRSLLVDTFFNKIGILRLDDDSITLQINNKTDVSYPLSEVIIEILYEGYAGYSNNIRSLSSLSGYGNMITITNTSDEIIYSGAFYIKNKDMDTILKNTMRIINKNYSNVTFEKRKSIFGI